MKQSVVLVLLALGFAACGGDDEETTTVRGGGRAPTKSATTTSSASASKSAAGAGATAAKGSGDAAAAGKIGDVGPFTYKPGRDPFQSYFDITGETQQTTTLEPLQKHDLSKFKVTAIVTGTVQPAAVVLDPNGRAHLIKRGTLLGPPRGRVAQILSDRVVVEREFKDRLERVHKLKSELRLRVDDEEPKQ